MASTERQEPTDDNTMEKKVFETIRAGLLAQGIMYSLIEHQPVYTMEQAAEACQSTPEQGVKVLFLRYKIESEYQYCLVVWVGSTSVDLKGIATHMQVKKVSLASPTEVREQLGIDIGALSPFGYQKSFPVVLDSELLLQDRVFINAGAHDKTIVLSPQDMKKMIEQQATKLIVV